MLKSLTLNGFKSFAKKSELEFGSSVSAIVGPNGSGKSNIVEAFRFVLGEQSIKSMRGKSGSDLIFKGSKNIAKLNRAKVSVVFDNSTKVFSLARDEHNGISVDFEEIEISREVFADGTNKYSLNGTEVRLRDIHEILASVHIGSSGHHIISQGQADRLLSTNPKERRAMIEDALGLKVYQIKMKDAEKRLEKTEQNSKEIESLRREIAPHIRYLKKQVDKIKQAEELRTSLASMYKEYLAKQDYLLGQEYSLLIQQQSAITESIGELDQKIMSVPEFESGDESLGVVTNIQALEKEISTLRQTRDEVSRNIGRLEAKIDMVEVVSLRAPSHAHVSVPKEEFDKIVRDCMVAIDRALKGREIQGSLEALALVQQKISSLQRFSEQNDVQKKDIQTTSFDKKDLEHELAALKQSLEEVTRAINTKQDSIYVFQKQQEQARLEIFEKQKVRFQFENERTKLVSDQQLVQERLSRARESRTALEEEIQEGIVLVGKEILSYKSDVVVNHGFDKSMTEELRRSIERTKIKLEEAGALGGEDALQEYNEVVARDEFLQKELQDLEQALVSLKTLIADLKISLDTEFKEGISKINTEFQEFFSVMFGGGNAKLVVQATKQKARSEDLSDEEEMEETQKEEGVDIQVSLPQKKVTELTMLSGGERSLTSIALLFAMTQVNPPPFLVLDETDAALDEANSRRYGDMIERLAQYSQLIVVTHNRETMSRARSLYGVTIGSDGASKLLSIKFDTAEQYAK